MADRLPRGSINELGFGLFLSSFLERVIEHGGAHTVFPLLAHEDVIVHAALASTPKLFVVGKFGIGYRFIAEIGVDLHDSQAGRESKDFGFGIFLPL